MISSPHDSLSPDPLAMFFPALGSQASSASSSMTNCSHCSSDIPAITSHPQQRSPRPEHGSDPTSAFAAACRATPPGLCSLRDKPRSVRASYLASLTAAGQILELALGWSASGYRSDSNSPP